MSERRLPYRTRREAQHEILLAHLRQVGALKADAKEPTIIEAELMAQLHEAGLLKYFIHDTVVIPGERYRFDLVDARHRITIECQGGTWKAGTGHNTGQGLARDYRKSNMAQMLGWLCFQFDTTAIENGDAMKMITAAIQKAEDGEL